MPEVVSDRRGAQRFPLILVVEVAEYPTGAKLNARTSDVSRSGCYIDTLNPIQKGSTVRLKLTHKGESFETIATVMYVSPGLGMGIAFQEPIQPSQLPILDRWLRSASGP
jgi:hypothetical protein